MSNAIEIPVSIAQKSIEDPIPASSIPIADGQRFKRTKTISGSGVATAQGKTKTGEKIREKSVQQIIRDSSGVGTDIRSRAASVPPKSDCSQHMPFENTFIKPLSMDPPKPLSKGDNVEGAVVKVEKSMKRHREGEMETYETAGEAEPKEEKKKKKKKVVE